MAKSLGNFYTVRHLLQQFSGLALRLMLLSTHYRKPLNFTENTLKKSEELLTKLHRPLLRHGDIVAKKQVPSDLIEALSMDVNTPLALKILWQYHKHFTAQPSPESKGMYLGALEILGLQPITKGETDTVPPMVASLARERAVAKEHKDWKTADKLREEIKELNYEIVDTRDGYKIYKL